MKTYVISKKQIKKWSEYIGRSFRTKEGIGVLITVCTHPDEPCLEFLMDDEEFKKKYFTDTLQVNFSEIDYYNMQPTEAGTTFLSEAEEFLSRLSANGKIVSSGDCSNEEIIRAQACGRFYVAQNTLGFVYYPERPKRSPLPDGTLPLTEEEFKEFCLSFQDCTSIRVITANKIEIRPFVLDMFGDPEWVTLNDCAAILWLAKRFDLEEK